MQKSGAELFWFGFDLAFCVVIRAILASEPFPWQRYYHHLFTVALLLLILLLFCRVVYWLGTATSCVLVRSFSPSISRTHINFLFCFVIEVSFFTSRKFFSRVLESQSILQVWTCCVSKRRILFRLPPPCCLWIWKTIRTVPGFSLLDFTRHRATFNRWFMRVFSWL